MGSWQPVKELRFLEKKRGNKHHAHPGGTPNSPRAPKRNPPEPSLKAAPNHQSVGRAKIKISTANAQPQTRISGRMSMRRFLEGGGQSPVDLCSGFMRIGGVQGFKTRRPSGGCLEALKDPGNS